MGGKLSWIRAACAAAAAAAALLLGPGRAAAHLDGAGLFALPPDRVVLPEAPCKARREPSRGVAGQLRALKPQAERLRDTMVVPMFMGFQGIGLKVRGKL